jgi:alanine-synthesizing transaminase
LYSYSNRLSWNFSRNAITQKIGNLRHRGFDLLNLANSNPTETLGSYLHDSIRNAFSRVQNFAYTPDPFGLPSAVDAVTQYYRRREISVSAERVMLTASTSEAYSFLFKLFCNPGDEVLVPIPSYPLFEYLARLENIHAVPYRLAYDGSWFIDFHHLQQQISERSRAIVVVNPNNPTGSFLKTWEIERLADVALERRLPIISDEVLMDYRHSEDPVRLSTFINCEDALSFSLNGLSKAAGMPQLKVGWIVVNGPRDHRENSYRRLELISDTFLSVGTPVQLALPDLLVAGETIQQAIRARLAANLAALQQRFENSSVQLLNLEGGWSAILQVPANSSEEVWIDRLLDAGVIVQPGYFFDMESGAHLVVSLITAESEFRRGVEIIREFADQA